MCGFLRKSVIEINNMGMGIILLMWIEKIFGRVLFGLLLILCESSTKDHVVHVHVHVKDTIIV